MAMDLCIMPWDTHTTGFAVKSFQSFNTHEDHAERWDSSTQASYEIADTVVVFLLKLLAHILRGQGREGKFATQ